MRTSNSVCGTAKSTARSKARLALFIARFLRDRISEFIFQRLQSPSLLLLLRLSTLLLTCTARASDWPHLLGPTRDAVYAGPALADKWPTEGPRIVWNLDVGGGYSSPVVAEGRLIQCHRLEDQFHVECLDPATGKRRWTFKHEMKFKDGAYFDHGPRPTPAIRDGKVYVHNTARASFSRDQ